jgi:hypothetical protein
MNPRESMVSGIPKSPICRPQGRPIPLRQREVSRVVCTRLVDLNGETDGTGKNCASVLLINREAQEILESLSTLTNSEVAAIG